MNIIIKPITYFYPKRNFLRTFTELLALSIKTRLLRICCGAQRCLKNWLRFGSESLRYARCDKILRTITHQYIFLV